MKTYDGVPVKIIAENTRGDLELEVTEKYPGNRRLMLVIVSGLQVMTNI